MNEEKYVSMTELGSLYPAHIETIKSRHDRALERAGAGHAVVFSGAPHVAFLDDYVYPFIANPHFVGWLPLTNTAFCYLVYTPGETPILVYYQEKDYWHTPPSDPTGYWTDFFDIRVVHKHEDVAVHLPVEREKCVFIGDIRNEAQAWGIERQNPASVVNMLHYNRGVKTAYELECMRGASRRAVAGHIAAENAFRNGKSEFSIHLEYCDATAHVERELPYGNIIALNDHGAIMHYQHQSHTVPQPINSFLIDAGASIFGYAADITRSYSYDSSEFAELIDRFDVLQLELVAEVRAGLDFKELHLLTHRKIADLLIELDFARGSSDALIENDVTAAFFPTGLGHLLGIQVHDVGGFLEDDTGNVIDRPSGHPFLRLTRELQVDQVLTVEPGMYIIDMLLDNLQGTPGHAMVNRERVDWLRPFGGVRIEDNVRVLADGCENMTRDAFAAT